MDESWEAEASGEDVGREASLVRLRVWLARMVSSTPRVVLGERENTGPGILGEQTGVELLETLEFSSLDC